MSVSDACEDKRTGCIEQIDSQGVIVRFVDWDAGGFSRIEIRVLGHDEH